jgi:hypothetical protein
MKLTQSMITELIIMELWVIFCLLTCFGRNRQGSMATNYGLDRPEIESRWEGDILYTSRLAGWPTYPPVYMGIGKDTGTWPWQSTPYLLSRLKKNRAVPSLFLWAFMVCYRVKFTLSTLSHVYVMSMRRRHKLTWTNFTLNQSLNNNPIQKKNRFL